MPRLRFITDFDRLPASREPPHARIVRAEVFNKETIYEHLPAIDAVMTVLYHHSREELETFLDPQVNSFKLRASMRYLLDLVITREKRAVEVSRPLAQLYRYQN